jgi:hypothetical protein
MLGFGDSEIGHQRVETTTVERLLLDALDAGLNVSTRRSATASPRLSSAPRSPGAAPAEIARIRMRWREVADAFWTGQR